MIFELSDLRIFELYEHSHERCGCLKTRKFENPEIRKCYSTEQITHFR